MLVMKLASAFYTSGAFWGGAGFLAAVLGTVAGVWVTLIVGFPRRRLYYWIIERGSQKGKFVIPAGAARRELVLKLAGRCRKDIPSDAYDDRQPLTLDVDTPIVEILGVTSVPKTVPIPQIAADGTSLKIGPSLIGKRQDITIRILIDGNRDRDRRLTCQSPLIDVQIKRSRPATAAEIFWMWSGVLGFSAAIQWVSSAVQQQVENKQFAAFVFWLAVVLAVAGLVAWVRRKRREND